VREPFHPGEIEIQRRAGVREMADRVGRIIGSAVTPAAQLFLARQRLVVATTLDGDGGVWASLLTGAPGLVTAVDETLLRIQAEPADGDPLLANLKSRPEFGLLVIDVTTRQRMRFNGRGLVSPEGLFLLVDRAYGNCPKYIQMRRLEDGEASPGTTRRLATLNARQSEWIAGADTFFIASFHPQGGPDASHRGGRPGFVNVLGADHLVFPDYPGNAMFNTLGNLSAYPQAGLLFVDFATGGVLQLTGRATVSRDLSVEFHVDRVLETPRATRLRFEFIEFSPAIPVTPEPLRHPTDVSR